MSRDDNLSQSPEMAAMDFLPSEPGETLQPNDQIGNVDQRLFFNATPNIEEPLRFTVPFGNPPLNRLILAQNDFGRFAVEQIASYSNEAFLRQLDAVLQSSEDLEDQESPQNLDAQQSPEGLDGQERPQNLDAQQPQIFQQTIVFNVPTRALGEIDDTRMSGVVPTRTFTIAPNLSMFQGGNQNAQPGVDPIFQVLQASFNQIGRGNHRATSSLGLDSVLHFRILNDESLECPISAETLTKGEWASRMPCGHYFANESLAVWLAQKNTCPVCRFELHTGNAPVILFNPSCN
jgi:hypothetical protein